MVKKAKAFSKIFTSGEVRKGLLASSSKEEDGEAPERSETAGSFEDEFPLDRDFPLAPTSGRAHGDEDDIFADNSSRRKKEVTGSSSNNNNDNNFDKSDLFDFPDSAADFSAKSGGFSHDAGAFPEAGAFPDGDAFPGAGTFGSNDAKGDDGFGAFTPSNHDKEKDDEEEDDDDDENPEFDITDLPDTDSAAFFASFSDLGKAQEAMQQPQAPSEDGKKKTRRLTRLFNKKKDVGPTEPVVRCAEIVVDKSKIPTTKIEMELVNGELVTPKHHNLPETGPEEEDGKEKKSRLKSLKKTLKDKAAGLGVGILKNERIEDTSEQDRSYANEEKNFPSDHEESENQDEDGSEIMADDSQKRDGVTIQRIRQRRRQGGDPLPSDTQRRARRRATESRLDGQKMRQSNSSDGVGGRLTSSKDDLAGSSRVRRTRTEEGTGASRRRNPMLDNSQTSPRRTSSKHSIGSDGIDESKMKGESTNGPGNHRSSGSRRHRDSSGRKQTTRKSTTSDTPRRSKSGDGMSSSAHHPVIRRTQTEGMSMSSRRAASTRHLMGESSLRETPHRSSAASGRDGLSNRDRLRRASRSERNLLVRDDKDKKEALGNLFGGGFGMDKDKEAGPKRRNRAGSDGNLPPETLEEGENESETEVTESEPTMNESGFSIADEESEEEDNGTMEGGTSASVAVSSFASGNSLTKEEIKKLVRAIAYQAKHAKDEDDLEAIVMGALGGESNASLRDICDKIENVNIDDNDTHGSELDESGTTLSAKDIHERTHKYVNSFLRSNGSARGARDPGKQQAGRDYTGVFKNFAGTSSRPDSDGDSSQESDDEIEDETKKGRERISIVDVAKKRDIVKAAKVLDKDRGNMKPEAAKSSGKVDFSAVTSRLEAKADAKNRARMRSHQGVVAK